MLQHLMYDESCCMQSLAAQNHIDAIHSSMIEQQRMATCLSAVKPFFVADVFLSSGRSASACKAHQHIASSFASMIVASYCSDSDLA